MQGALQVEGQAVLARPHSMQHLRRQAYGMLRLLLKHRVQAGSRVQMCMCLLVG
jgi:hypothetical protein